MSRIHIVLRVVFLPVAQPPTIPSRRDGMTAAKLERLERAILGTSGNFILYCDILIPFELWLSDNLQ